MPYQLVYVIRVTKCATLRSSAEISTRDHNETIPSAPYKLLTTFTFLEDAIKTTQTANEFGAPRKHEGSPGR